jgi:hypothetical protein
MADGQEIHERISDVDPVRRSYRFEHLRVALPVRSSGGTLTVAEGPDPTHATVILTTTFDGLDSTGDDQLAAMIESAFGQSLESLRRYIEDHVPWNQT